MTGKKILIVEDEVMVAMTLEDTLEALGYEVAGTVDNGSDAIRLAAEKEPDLILMDIRIRGDIDGIETADRIAETMDIPVVFLTAHSDEQTLMRALKTQPYGFLIKPFRERELYSNIEMAIHKHRVLKKRGQAEGISSGAAAAAPPAAAGPAPVSPQLRQKEAVESGTDPEHLKNLVFEALESPIFVLNDKLKIVLYNRKFAELCAFFNIPESAFRASAEKAGLFPFFGSANDIRLVFAEGRGSSLYQEVRTEDKTHNLKISIIPVREGHKVVNVMVATDDVTYQEKLRESGDIYHKTAENVIRLSNELKHALKDHADPVLREIAETSDDMVLGFAKMDEEWIQLREYKDIPKLWER